MSKYTWPVSMLEGFNIPVETLVFFQGYVEGSEQSTKDLEELYNKHQLLKDTSAKQERYIAELEKQIGLLQKTLDLVDKNKPRFLVKRSSADIVDMFNREPVILHTEADSIIPIYPDRWIPVTEGMPKLIPCGAGTAYSEAVNVLTSGRKVLTAIWDGFNWICDAEFWDAEDEEITHWTPVLLPLPEPPKESCCE